MPRSSTVFEIGKKQSKKKKDYVVPRSNTVFEIGKKQSKKGREKNHPPPHPRLITIPGPRLLRVNNPIDT